jgi:hypothetical protein
MRIDGSSIWNKTQVQNRIVFFLMESSTKEKIIIGQKSPMWFFHCHQVLHFI